MVEQRNIVILGASFSGLQATQYIMKHTLPALKVKHNAKYHVYVISPSADFFFRVAAPRATTSSARLAAEKIFVPLEEVFRGYSTDNFTFIQAAATGLNTSTRTVSYSKSDYLQDETLHYHALIAATGSRTHHPSFSMSTSSQATLDAIKSTNTKISTAKNIIIVGGGPTGVETAGEIGELLNGRPGWFSTPPRKANVTLITAAKQLLPTLRPDIAKTAELQLKQLGVDVLYDTRVADISPTASKSITITLSQGKKLEADMYIPAHGVLPNSSFLPPSLLTPNGYLKTNTSTLRVDAAGPRVYALGDISSASRNHLLDIMDGLPVLMVNLKRDLLSYDPDRPLEAAPGKDRNFEPSTKEAMLVPVGSAGGVGAAFGWRLPNWFVWMIKSRDFMVGGLGLGRLRSGANVGKAVVWRAEEAVV